MKRGVKTIPLEVDDADEIKLIEAEFGLKGWVTIRKLQQFIGEHGYYVKWDIDTQLLFMRERCLDTVGRGCVSEIVACAVRRGVFDKGMFQKHGILTSKRCQETYLTTYKRSQKVVFEKEYALPIVYDFIESVNKSGKSVNIFWKSVSNSEPILNEIKLNKTKLNEIKEVSKKESKKENIQTYDEIFSDLEVGENLKRALLDFIRHLKVNGVVMINSRLEALILRLDEVYANDELSKCKEIRKAIVNGYKRLPCEGADL